MASMILDFSAYFWKKSDLSMMRFEAPVGAAYTASLYADDPGGTAELHFFDCDNRELDNTGFDACSVPKDHVGICSILNTQMQASNVALLPTTQSAKIRIRNAGNTNLYIGQRGDYKEVANNTGGVNNLFLFDGTDIANAEFETIAPN